MPRSFSSMLERPIQAVRTDDPGLEEPAATRERLRSRLPAGATRRMTQLGLLLAGVLDPLEAGEDAAIVYATAYGESRTLRDYLASFPTPSPTLFQTSIHPSAVQQVRVARQAAVREFLPFAGKRQLVAHAVQGALLSPAARVVLCGGEERNDWLAGSDAASPRTFAFALELGKEAATSPSSAIGRLRLEAGPDEPGELTLPEFFDALHRRAPLRRQAARGWTLSVEWR